MDPISGVNIVSTGNSVTNPYKTITFALEQAQPGTIIQLAPGSYTNESFPIILKQGITLRGDESTKGKTVVISGGGDYNSRSFARQNVTILAEQDSTINGVTVTNRNARGTGVWVESTNPVIKNSTFAQSLREGIFVTAGGDPTVENNQFTANNGNGISITKSSKGKISNNVIEKSGFGLSINHDSKPVLTKKSDHQ
ncbi:abp3 protein [Cylindrospermopsis raciborskii CS-505]|nr:abp3 protein [Cylindrospermopsis raciborskii CS-505]